MGERQRESVANPQAHPSLTHELLFNAKVWALGTFFSSNITAYDTIKIRAFD